MILALRIWGSIKLYLILVAWLSIDIIGRKCLLITPRTERVNWSTGLMDFEKRKFLPSLKRNEIAQQILLIPKMQKKKPLSI